MSQSSLRCQQRFASLSNNTLNDKQINQKVLILGNFVKMTAEFDASSKYFLTIDVEKIISCLSVSRYRSYHISVKTKKQSSKSLFYHVFLQIHHIQRTH
jgi:hypothetical protein